MITLFFRKPQRAVDTHGDAMIKLDAEFKESNPDAPSDQPVIEQVPGHDSNRISQKIYLSIQI